MLGFPRLRNKFQGKINKFAFIGMAGDIAVISGLYGMYKYYKIRQEEALPELRKKVAEESL